MKTEYRKWMGKKLQKLRELLQLSQESFAALIGKKRDCYRSYEEGRAEPNILTLKKICRIHNLSVDSFLEDAPEETPAQ